MFLTEDEVLMK